MNEDAMKMKIHKFIYTLKYVCEIILMQNFLMCKIIFCNSIQKFCKTYGRMQYLHI